MKPLGNLIYVADADVVASALWAMHWITDRDVVPGSKLAEEVNLPRISELMMEQKVEIVIPALRVIGSLCLGGTADVDKALSAQCLEGLVHILTTTASTSEAVCYACWTLSNIMAGPARHVQTVINAGLVPMLSAVVLKSTHYDVGSRTLVDQT